MALQISEFTGVAALTYGQISPLPSGAPIAVTNPSNGAFVFNAATRLIRVNGTGTITWPGIATPETFSTQEFRQVAGGAAVTIG